MTCPLLLDEMLSPKIAEQLRQLGHDVHAVADRPDLVGLADEQVLSLGADEDRVVVTLNIADFAALHAEWQAEGRSHSGILYASSAAFPQDRAFIGAVVGSLAGAERSGDMPGRDATCFLKREPLKRQ